MGLQFLHRHLDRLWPDSPGGGLSPYTNLH